MLIQKLEAEFFEENSHLVEVLDKRNGVWDGEKERGYGILLISYNSLRFGIPLRSHIKHKFCFFTDGSKGLDYTKAVLLVKDDYISQTPFMIPSDEYVKIKDRTHHIGDKFSKYVNKYVDGVGKNDRNVLRDYRFSTLQNYHKELGLL
ncbi:type III toxin-antitoxin system TenpIN family toxin [Halomonas sp. SpR8]|uniref:type III toxin-antitoxin system TenpIN family toxin n=1 Tax=Halomonas sp. SpR8 TaxID=3050463 RepID=UPI0027E50106|nr:hypothetical protein [Halomonas sp. SpR8]MDQ7731047.1 hypothetical protein [Halomonas sp. SpR8]